MKNIPIIVLATEVPARTKKSSVTTINFQNITWRKRKSIEVFKFNSFNNTQKIRKFGVGSHVSEPIFCPPTKK